MPLAGHDDIDRVGVLVGLGRAILGSQLYKIAGIMEIRVHQFDMLIVPHRPPNGHGFGGKHTIGEDYSEEAAGLQNAIDVTEDFDGLRKILNRDG
jgi:hypothetical protein